MRIIEIEDKGQDFTEFHVDDVGVVIDAQPFQDWVWKGMQVISKIRVGEYVKLKKIYPDKTSSESRIFTLKYRITSVRTV